MERIAMLDFDNPLDSIQLLVFGLVFWTIATGLRTAAGGRNKVFEISRHNPWFVLRHKRPATSREGEGLWPPFFQVLFGGAGLAGQVIGLLVGTFGLLHLIVALAQKIP